MAEDQMILISDPTSRGDMIASEVRQWYEDNREGWWARHRPGADRYGEHADSFIYELIAAVQRAGAKYPDPPMTEILQHGTANPLLVVSSDEVLAWLRELADKAGLGDRMALAVQISVEQPFEGGATNHMEPPRLTLMLSNIPNSRQNSPTLERPAHD